MRGVLVAVVLIASASMALAVRRPAHLAGRAELEVAEQGAVRAQRTVQWHVPHSRTQAAWNQFLTEFGPGWSAYWDGETGVPRRIFGVGAPMPGAMASAADAERHARRVLADHIGLLAPGASPSDFSLASNHIGDGIRSVGFYQHADGVRVLGGQVSMQFKADRLFVIGSEAFADVKLDVPAAVIHESTAKKRAVAWISELAQASPPVAGVVEGPFALPLIRPDGTAQYPVVVRVRVDLADPVGRWDVYLDAVTARRVARRQTLQFATGTVLYDTPVRWPEAGRADYPAVSASVTVDGADDETSPMGTVTWSGDVAAALMVRAAGSRVTVQNAAGAEVVDALTLEPGSTATWSAADDEFIDAQITTFVHAEIVKTWASALDPDNEFFTTDVQLATVNIDQACNAFSDGTNINFFQSAQNCTNTGRMPDVIYHEYGHSLHEHSIIPGVGDFDGALSEGLSDYVAATINDDPAMGLGFFRDDRSLRHIDLTPEAVWPDDVGESHITGIIFAGAMWDLRKHLVASYGQDEGVALADATFYAAIRRSADIPSTYVQMLAADDDDGNLANGTPNQCAINEAFSRHGLAEPGADIGPRVLAPVRDGFRIALPVTDSSLCPDASVGRATLSWQVRGDEARSGTVPMELTPGELVASIPAQPFGDVVQYRVELETLVGDVASFPLNQADPMYEFFVGSVTELYCTDFEGDVEPEGWVHELVAGEAGEGADDWQWGAPLGKGDDPRVAYSGTKIYGNDLGEGNFNGLYQPDKTNRLLTPVVSTGGFDTVRLQYRRWLQVEDGASDQASISANETELWTNATASGDPIHHFDGEWRFHDVDLSAAVVGGDVQVAFQLASDGGLDFGGWNIDEVCIVGYRLPECGNSEVEDGEDCDDGNDVDDDTCTNDCIGNFFENDAGPGGGSSVEDSSCGCRAARSGHLDAWFAVLALATLLRRRRRAK